MVEKLYAVRGAITADNTEKAIYESTKELLFEICKENNIKDNSQIISVFFTSTSDLTADFPAKAARLIGWTRVPMLCAKELEIKDSLNSCIRVLIHFYANEENQEVKHVYLKEAKSLRPDLEYWT